MMEGESPRKNLWKNLKTQKTKLSGVHQSQNSPVICKTDYSEPMRKFQLQKNIVINRGNQDFENQFTDVERQLHFLNEDENHFQQPHGNHNNQKNLYVAPVRPLQPIQSQAIKSRRLSIGEQSVVEEIVDFKNPNSLQIADFQEDQQPMIMSLGSQSNPAIRMLKLSRVKDDLEKLQKARLQILKYLSEEKQKYMQVFQKTFHELLTYVIFFYSEKSSQEIDSDNEKNSIFYSGNFRKSLGEEDTPRFAKLLKSKRSDQRERQQKHNSQAQISYEQQIHRLEEELFKSKLQSQGLEEQLRLLKRENQQMNQSIFDYQQKIAQFELEVNKKVDEIVETRVKEVQKMQTESDRQYYLDQILSLEKEIQNLEKNSYNQAEYLELNQIGEKLEKKSEHLNQVQMELEQKGKELNLLQVELNSQKLQIQKRVKILQSKEIELRSLQSKLQQKEIELALKEKEINNKSIQADKQSSIFEKSRLNHRRKDSEDHQYGYADLNIKNITSFQTTDPLRNRYGNSSYVAIQPSRNWSYALPQKHENKQKSTQMYLKNQTSKQKSKKQKSFQKSFTSYSRPVSSKVHNNQSSSYSSTLKHQDKSRLEDLGTKLQNLRNQIRKQIRDTE